MANKKAPKLSPAATGPFDSKQVALLEHNHELSITRYSPCGKFLFAGSYDSNVYRWSISDGEAGNELSDGKPPTIEKQALNGHKGWLQGIVFHPDKKRMFTGDSWGTLICWEYAESAPKPKWTRPEGHTRWMRNMAISADGELLATCGADQIIKLWSTADGSLKWESPRQENQLHSVAFHPKENMLLVGDLMGNVKQWDLATKKVVRTLDAKFLYLRPMANGVQDINDIGGVRQMNFDREGKYLACCGAQPVTSGFFTAKPAIVLIDWASGKSQNLQWEGADPKEGITLDIVWHPDGYMVAGSSGQAGNGALYCWKPDAKVPAYIDKKMVNCRSVAVHPDGKKFAVAQVHQQAGRGGNGRHAAAADEYLSYAASVRIFQSTKA